MNDHAAVRELSRDSWPPLLGEMRDPPKRLFVRGTLPDPAVNRYLCVVGSRRHSDHAKDACERLIGRLAGRGIAIVSGLALGIDSVAHRAALGAGLPTVAIPGSGITDDTIYPRSHLSLAREILERGGAILGETTDGGAPGAWSFPRRNRIMAGIADATLIIEAGEKSGTLITARLALEYDRSVLVVPGRIFDPHTTGSNALIKDGAIVVTEPSDILDALGMSSEPQAALDLPLPDLSDGEKRVLGALREPLAIEDLARATGMRASEASAAVSNMEIKGIVRNRMGKIERAR